MLYMHDWSLKYFQHINLLFRFSFLRKISCLDSQRMGKYVFCAKQIGLWATVHICLRCQNRWVQVVLEIPRFFNTGVSTVSLVAQTPTFIYSCHWQDDESASVKMRQFPQVNIFHTINFRHFFFLPLVATHAEWQFQSDLHLRRPPPRINWRNNFSTRHLLEVIIHRDPESSTHTIRQSKQRHKSRH